MKISFCIGNGPSKNKFDLSKLKNAGPVYGCNNLIEKFNIDNTIAVDKDIVIDLISRGYNSKTNIYTRKKWHNLIQADNLHYLNPPIDNPVTRWDNDMQWGSGTHSINLAAKHGANIVVIIGYDLYNTGLNPNCWIYQINKCFELHSNTQFVQIQDDNWVCPTEWKAENFLLDNFHGLTTLLSEI